MNDSTSTDTAPTPVGVYPHARRVDELLFLSGIGPRTPGSNAIPGNVLDASGKLIGHDIAAQTRQVFANVRAVLEASGARWEDLVDVTVFLTDMAGDFKAYNAVWAEFFPDPAAAPCRTTLGITALPTPIAIELKCITQARHPPAAARRPFVPKGVKPTTTPTQQARAQFRTPPAKRRSPSPRRPRRTSGR